MKFLALLSIFFLFIEYFEFQGGTNAVLTGARVQHIENVNYMVSIKIKGANDTFFCGGAIYDFNKFVTAAHCLYNMRSATVSLGSLKPFDEMVDFDLENDEFVLHPDWQPGLFDHDIAVGFTPMDMIFCESINKIEVVEESYTVRENLSVAAYGYGASNDNVINNLRQTVTHVMEFHICSNIYSLDFQHALNEDKHFCLKLDQNGKNHLSHGDSGGPIVSFETGELIGVIVAGEKGNPDVGLKIAGYRKFLADPEAFEGRSTTSGGS